MYSVRYFFNLFIFLAELASRIYILSMSHKRFSGSIMRICIPNTKGPLHLFTKICIAIIAPFKFRRSVMVIKCLILHISACTFCRTYRFVCVPLSYWDFFICVFFGPLGFPKPLECHLAINRPIHVLFSQSRPESASKDLSSGRSGTSKLPALTTSAQCLNMYI